MAHAVPELVSRLLGAIKAEQEAEQEALTQLYRRTRVERLMRDGLVLAGLR
jgi:hypothetical protein